MGFAQPPIVFLVAGPRGRWPVSRLLSTHHRVALVPDSVWITDLAAQRQTFEAPGGAKLFADAFVEHPASAAWGLTPEEVREAVGEDADFSQLARGILNTYAERREARLLVDPSDHVSANLHLLTFLFKASRVLLIREPQLTVTAPVATGYAMWFDGQTAINDAVATLSRTRWTAMRLDDLLLDPVGSIRTLVAYLEVGIRIEDFGPVEGLPVAAKPGHVRRHGPQKGPEPVPVRWVQALFLRYPKIGRKARLWMDRNRPRLERTMKKFRKVAK